MDLFLNWPSTFEQGQQYIHREASTTDKTLLPRMSALCHQACCWILAPVPVTSPPRPVIHYKALYETYYKFHLIASDAHKDVYNTKRVTRLRVPFPTSLESSRGCSMDGATFFVDLRLQLSFSPQYSYRWSFTLNEADNFQGKVQKREFFNCWRKCYKLL